MLVMTVVKEIIDLQHAAPMTWLHTKKYKMGDIKAPSLHFVSLQKATKPRMITGNEIQSVAGSGMLT